MSCCSLKVAGSNPVLGKFLKKKFHRGGAKGARDRILKTIGLSSGIFFDAFKAFFKTRTQCLGQLVSEGGVNSISDHLYRDTA